MRTLTESEVEQVTGGALNLGTGAIGAGIGAAGAGGLYAYDSMRAGNFSWGSLAFITGNAALSGFLVGSGATLLVAGANTSIRVAGAGAAGFGAVGGAIGNSAVSSSSAQGDGGGSK